MKGNGSLIQVKELVKYFPVHAGIMRRKIADIKAVDGVSFDIRQGETLGLVGESGCGKTTVGRCVLRLYDATNGHVFFEQKEITQLKGEQLSCLRRDMQLIFQDPYSSLNPRMAVGDIVGEPLLVHRLVSRSDEYRQKVAELMRMVELDPTMSDRYPHEFSGGQRQRIGVARALATRPKFIVCDEPVSAVDVSIQAQIIKLLMRLKKSLNLTYLFIAHDLSIVRYISNRIAVMYLGKVAELTDSDELYDNPLHPYPRALLSAIPVPDPKIDRQRKRILLSGDVPSPLFPPSGCRFHTRCWMAKDTCRESEPKLTESGSNHWVACHLTM